MFLIFGEVQFTIFYRSEKPQKLPIPKSTSVQTTVLEGAIQTPGREKVSIVLTIAL